MRVRLLLSALLFLPCALASSMGASAETQDGLTPRFAYRGMMIDCSRHFWTKEFIMKQTDAMAALRLNKLHLHLTDAGGWRVEIARYPRLTQTAAWRTGEDWSSWWVGGDRRYCEAGVAGAYGGFYTRQDIKGIVDHAAALGIDVIPEIEMPGHSEEVLYAYPSLACTGKPYGCSDLCVGSESTFEFVRNVLDEILEMFPSEIIHIGGDEAGRKAWEECPQCRSRMSAEGLETTAQLEVWFMRRVARYLESRGRRAAVWDEVVATDGGTGGPNYLVMAWRGSKSAAAAARKGYDVVVATSPYYYLDYYQDAPATQPAGMGDYMPLEHVWGYEPVPDSLEGTTAAERIIGVQGNLWTEMIASESHAERMLYPRIVAIAEKGWGSRQEESYEAFRQRAAAFCDSIRKRGYAPFDLSGEQGQRPESQLHIRHKAVGMPVSYRLPYADMYCGQGESTLTDGRRGGWSYNDGKWQGFIGRGRMDVVIDMRRATEMRSIAVAFMQFTGPEIYAPAELIISVSDNGEDFTEIMHSDYEVELAEHYRITTLRWEGKSTGRYVRIQARAGKYGGWIFADEVVIE